MVTSMGKRSKVHIDKRALETALFEASVAALDDAYERYKGRPVAEVRQALVEMGVSGDDLDTIAEAISAGERPKYQLGK